MGVGWVHRRWTTPQQLYLVSSVEKVLRLWNNNPQLKRWFFSFRSSNVEHCLTDYHNESALEFSWSRNVFSCCEVSNKLRTCSFIAFTDQFHANYSSASACCLDVASPTNVPVAKQWIPSAWKFSVDEESWFLLQMQAGVQKVASTPNCSKKQACQMTCQYPKLQVQSILGPFFWSSSKPTLWPIKANFPFLSWDLTIRFLNSALTPLLFSNSSPTSPSPIDIFGFWVFSILK